MRVSGVINLALPIAILVVATGCGGEADPPNGTISISQEPSQRPPEVIGTQRLCAPSACGPGEPSGPVVTQCSGNPSVEARTTDDVLVEVKPTGSGGCAVRGP